MHLDSANPDIRKPRGFFVDGRDAMQGDTKLVFAASGRDIAVGAGIHVGIYSHGNRRAHAFVPGDAIDPFQFGFALDIETEDALVERVLNFLTRFAHAGEGALGRSATGLQDAK